MKIGGLCEGYGGLTMGLQSVVGGEVAWHFEYDKHPVAILEHRFPGVPNCRSRSAKPRNTTGRGATP